MSKNEPGSLEVIREERFVETDVNAFVVLSKEESDRIIEEARPGGPEGEASGDQVTPRYGREPPPASAYSFPFRVCPYTSACQYTPVSTCRHVSHPSGS